MVELWIHSSCIGILAERLFLCVTSHHRHKRNLCFVPSLDYLVCFFRVLILQYERKPIGCICIGLQRPGSYVISQLKQLNDRCANDPHGLA